MSFGLRRCGERGKTHLIVNFIAFPWEAVHELPVWVRTSLTAESLSDLVTFERLQAFCFFGFLAHRDPEARVSCRKGDDI